MALEKRVNGHAQSARFYSGFLRTKGTHIILQFEKPLIYDYKEKEQRIRITYIPLAKEIVDRITNLNEKLDKNYPVKLSEQTLAQLVQQYVTATYREMERKQLNNPPKETTEGWSALSSRTEDDESNPEINV
jgi:hypothetical protein